MAKTPFPEQDGLTEKRKWGVMTAVGLSIFMATLDVNIVNVSLPTLVKELNTDFPTIQWVILAYVLILTSMTLSFSRLGDMRGKRNLFVLGLSIFVFGSLLCGLSPSINWLIGFRVLQGSGASMTQALGAAIVTEAFPSAERGKAMGVIGAVVSIGLASGPALGGLLISAFGWRSVFLVNLPIGVLAVTAALRFIPHRLASRKEQRFDLLGAAVLMATLAAYALGMTLGQRQGFDGGLPPVLLAGAGALFILFIAVERKTAQPMVDLTLFKNILFSLNLIMGWLVFVVVGTAFIVPFYLELVKGYPPSTVGLLMMVMPLSMGLISPFAGTLSDRHGGRGVTLIGLLICIGACLSLSTLSKDTSMLGIIARLAPLGVGMGVFQSPNNSAIMGAVPRHRLGVASGLMTLSRTLGHTTGIPLAGALFTALAMSRATGDLDKVAQAPPENLVLGVAGVYGAAAAVIVASAVLATIALYLDRRRAARAPAPERAAE